VDNQPHPELIDESVFIAPGAVVLGDVRLAAQSSVWYNAVLRGDTDTISIGPRTNVQDGAVIHVDTGAPCLIGAGVTIGHRAVVHGALVEDDVLIGIGAIVLSIATASSARDRWSRDTASSHRARWCWDCPAAWCDRLPTKKCNRFERRRSTTWSMEQNTSRQQDESGRNYKTGRALLDSGDRHHRVGRVPLGIGGQHQCSDRTNGDPANQIS
jgi:hypothetical protein